MTPAQQLFITKILKSDGDIAHITRHEAGHRLMWALVYPDRKTKYAVVDGLPQVRMVDEKQNKRRKIAQMSMEEIGKLTVIKLAGFAAEMLMLGLNGDGSVAEIAAFIAQDFLADEPMLDWHDDAEYGGDISDACQLIGRTVGWQNLGNTLEKFFKAVLTDLQSFADVLDKEQQEALKTIKEQS